MRIPVFVLNFNGRQLLDECLPSVLAAATASRHDAYVAVIDNGSKDDSRQFLKARFPEVEIIDRPNLGLVSFNSVVADTDCEVAVLLNNDVKLDRLCLDPLITPLISGPQYDSQCFMTAPQCRRFDGATYEGLKTAVQWRWGLVQATCLYAGHEQTIDAPGLTASAGPAMAVRRDKFLTVGGFDPRYWPGRLEDLDFAFRSYLAGDHARYVPESMIYHLGCGTFAALGQDGCDELALRNTLLFQWKNLRHPVHRVRHAAGLALRLAMEPLRSLATQRERRWRFYRAFRAALRSRRMVVLSAEPAQTARHLAREWSFFQRFHPTRIGRSTIDRGNTAPTRSFETATAEAKPWPLHTSRLMERAA